MDMATRPLRRCSAAPTVPRSMSPRRLLSTEYGPDGVQRRATLELWVDGDEGQPLRGAGTLISASSVRHPGLHADIAFFRWSVEGREGLGHYEVVRRDG